MKIENSEIVDKAEGYDDITRLERDREAVMGRGALPKPLDKIDR